MFMRLVVDEIATITGLASVLFILRALKWKILVSQKFTQILGKSNQCTYMYSLPCMALVNIGYLQHAKIRWTSS